MRLASSRRVGRCAGGSDPDLEAEPIAEVDGHGLVEVDGLLGAADGHDLGEALARRAALRGRLGDESSLGVRRSVAAGELARQDLALDLLIADEDTGAVLAPSPGDPVDSYEIPERLRRRVQLRDHTCRFPGCPVRATRCDLDHSTPHGKGGKTCPGNLVPLCRRHHRTKTFSGWRYTTIQPGHYLWTSPHGRHFLVGPGGTRALDPPRSTDPDAY